MFLVRTINPKKDSCQTCARRDRSIDSLGKRSVVEIKRTDNNASVSGVLLMQTHKVTAIQGYDSSLVGCGESQNLFI